MGSFDAKITTEFFSQGRETPSASLAPQVIYELRSLSCQCWRKEPDLQVHSEVMLGEVLVGGGWWDPPVWCSQGWVSEQPAPGHTAGLELNTEVRCGVENKSQTEQLTAFPSIAESEDAFPFILGKAGKQVGDKNNQILRMGIALVTSSQPQKYNFVLCVRSVGRWARGGCGVV